MNEDGWPDDLPEWTPPEEAGVEEESSPFKKYLMQEQEQFIALTQAVQEYLWGDDGNVGSIPWRRDEIKKMIDFAQELKLESAETQGEDVSRFDAILTMVRDKIKPRLREAPLRSYQSRNRPNSLRTF